MLMTIDESGDKGLQLANGSSPLFVMAAVLFPTPDIAAACEESIRRQRAVLNAKEFRFKGLTPQLRLAFLGAVVEHEFKYFAVVSRKERLKSNRLTPEKYHFEVVGRLVDLVRPELVSAKVVFDECGGRDTDDALAKFLKARAGKAGKLPRIASAVSARSRSTNLVQLADMVCGAVAFSAKDGKRDAGAYRDVLSRREGVVIEWPETEQG